MAKRKYKKDDVIVHKTVDGDYISKIEKVIDNINYRIETIYLINEKTGRLKAISIGGTISDDTIKHKKSKKVLEQYAQYFL